MCRFSKQDYFLITIATYLSSLLTLLFLLLLLFKTLPLEEARTNTKWCWIHYFLFTSFEKMGLGVSILFFRGRYPLLRKLVFLFFDIKNWETFHGLVAELFFGGSVFCFGVEVIRSRLYYEVKIVLVIKVDR